MPIAEHIKAREWRKRLGLSYAELADLTGYSAVTIRWMEKGLTPPRSAAHITGKHKSKPVNYFVWQRFKLCCAGVAAQLQSRNKFEW